VRGGDDGGESWMRRMRPRTGEGWGTVSGEEGEGGVSRIQTAAPEVREEAGISQVA